MGEVRKEDGLHVPTREGDRVEPSPVAGLNIRIQAAYKYLDELGVALWGDYNIGQEDRKVEAAKWLARQVEGVQAVLMDGRWNPE